MKRAILTVLVILCLLTMAFHGQAAMWVTCNVNQAGSGFGNVYINLSATDYIYGAWPAYVWFCAGSDNRMLATALTAISSGKQVLAYIDEYAYGSVYCLYLQN